MSSELIKLFAPLLMFVLWISFAFRVRSPILIIAGLFLASYAGCSANFEFIYRELHQAIQAIMLVYVLFYGLYFQHIFRVNLIFGILFVFIGISLIFVPFNLDIKMQLINYITMIGSVNFLYITIIQSRENLKYLMRFIVNLAVLLAIIGLLEYPFTEDRIQATFSNPNYYGLFLGVGVCLLNFYWSGWRKYIGILLLCVAILLSGSRSAMAFPILLYLWHIYRQGHILKAAGSVLLGLVIIVSLSNLVLTRFSDVEATSASDAERLILQKIVMRMADDYPLTGVGWGNFPNEFENYSSTAEAIVLVGGIIDMSNQERRVSHNDFYRILAELGWIALIVSIIWSIYGVRLIILKKGFVLNFIPPIWIGMMFFSLGHNNMNNVFFWFFIILPFFIESQSKLFKKM